MVSRSSKVIKRCVQAFEVCGGKKSGSFGTSKTYIEGDFRFRVLECRV